MTSLDTKIYNNNLSHLIIKFYQKINHISSFASIDNKQPSQCCDKNNKTNFKIIDWETSKCINAGLDLSQTSFPSKSCLCGLSSALNCFPTHLSPVGLLVKIQCTDYSSISSKWTKNNELAFCELLWFSSTGQMHAQPCCNLCGPKSAQIQVR